MSRFSIEATFTAIDKMTAPVTQMEKATRALSTGIRADFLLAQSRMENFGRTIKNTLGSIAQYAIAGAGIALGYLAKRGLDLASDLTEVQNVVDTTFGNNADVINNFANTALEKFGLSILQAKQFSSTIGAMVKPSGMASDKVLQMSQDMAGLAGDFASFYNIPIEEAFNKIRSGISGETEPLKQLGKDMSVASLQAFALTQGITKQYQAMSQAEKYQLRYNYLMASSKDQMGDFSKTLSSSQANQARLFWVQIDQISAQVMSKLLPSLLGVTKQLNEFLKTIDTEKLGNNIKNIVDSFISFIKTLYNFRKAIIAIIGVWYIYRTALNAAAVSLWAFKIAKIAAIAVMKIFLFLQNSQTLALIRGLAIWALQTVALYSFAIAVVAASSAMKILNFIMSMNPVVLIIGGIILLIYWIYTAIQNWNDFGAAMLAAIGPMGWIVEYILMIRDYWASITDAFTSGGILSGLKQIGLMLLDTILYPLQQILELASNIPGLGDIAKTGAEKLKGLRLDMGMIAGEKKEVIPKGIDLKTEKTSQFDFLKNMELKTEKPKEFDFLKNFQDKTSVKKPEQQTQRREVSTQSQQVATAINSSKNITTNRNVTTQQQMNLVVQNLNPGLIQLSSYYSGS